MHPQYPQGGGDAGSQNNRAGGRWRRLSSRRGRASLSYRSETKAFCAHRCREAEAQGAEKIELGALAAAVIAVREGLAPLSPDEYVAMAAGLGVEGLGSGSGSGNNAQLAALPQVRLADHRDSRFRPLCAAARESVLPQIQRMSVVASLRTKISCRRRRGG